MSHHFTHSRAVFSFLTPFTRFFSLKRQTTKQRLKKESPASTAGAGSWSMVDGYSHYSNGLVALMLERKIKHGEAVFSSRLVGVNIDRRR
jgi:hypothetical protein